MLTAEVEDDLADAIFFNRYSNSHEVAGTSCRICLLNCQAYDLQLIFQNSRKANISDLKQFILSSLDITKIDISKYRIYLKEFNLYTFQIFLHFNSWALLFKASLA